MLQIHVFWFEMERLRDAQPRGRQQPEQSTVGQRTKSAYGQQIVCRLQKRHDLLLGIDVRNQPPMSGAEKRCRQNRSTRIKLRAVLGEWPQHFKSARPGQRSVAPRTLRPPYHQIQRDRTAMTGLVGEAPEGKQLPTSDSKGEAHLPPGREMIFDECNH